jgi:ATP-dependent protease ClpP protease subunit
MSRNLIINGQLHLNGVVGKSEEGGEGFTTTDVALALADLGPGDVTVRLNSGGGIAYDGMTIYSQLAAHPGKVTISIDGVAASAASLLAMAGDVIEMREGAMMMIHDPSNITFGTARDHEAAAAALNKLADNYAAVYAARAGKEVKPMRDIMLATTWLNADEAVAAGFATAKIEAKSVAMAKFDYTKYGAVPAAMLAATLKTPPLSAAIAVATLAAARLRLAEAATL